MKDKLNEKISNGWNEWSRHVLLELERLNECYDELRKELQCLKIEISNLKGQAAVWSIVIAIITSAVVSIIMKTLSH